MRQLPRSRPGSFGLWVALAALAGFAARLLYQAHTDRLQKSMASDDDWYHAMGQQIADHLTYHKPFAGTPPYSFALADPATSQPTAWHPPGWPSILALADTLGISGFDQQQAVGALLGMGTIVLVALVVRRVAGDLAGILAAWVAALYLPMVANDSLLLSEAPFVLGVVLALLLAVRAVQEPTLRRVAIAGAGAGATIWFRGEGALFSAMLALGLLLAVPRPRLRDRLVTGAVALGCALLVFSPWMVRNLTTFERPVLVSTGFQPVLAGANCDGAYHGDNTGTWDIFCVARLAKGAGLVTAEPRGVEESVLAERWQKAGLRYMGDHLDRLPVVMVARVARTWQLWNPRLEARVAAFNHGYIPSLVDWSTAAYALVGLLAAFGAWTLRRRRELIVLLVPVAAVTLTSAVGFGEIRFRASAEPSLAMLAGVGLAVLVRAGRARLGARPRVGSRRATPA
jgi:4-amino-4-deoxy-L-arabinose transferase-like glycosyltransferase